MSDNILKRNTDNFSIVDTVANVAVNHEFTTGYIDWKKERNTEKAFVWEAMNAIGDDIAETIYDNIVNYIDNVGNIDTCKVKALFSMSQVLGIVNNGFKGLIDQMPDEVLHLMDLFSINKAFATKFKVNCSALTNTLYDAALRNIDFKSSINDTINAVSLSTTGLSDQTILSTMMFDFNLPEDTYRRFVSAAFYNCLSSHLFNTYDGRKFNIHDLQDKKSELPLYDTLFYNYDNNQDGGLSSGYINNIDIDLSVAYQNELMPKYKKIENLKKANNRLNFDPYKIATAIMDGNDLIDRYSGVDRQMIDLVLEARADTTRVYNNSPLTKYAYYHRKDAIDYLQFINSFYDATRANARLQLSNVTTYIIDPEYLEVGDSLVKNKRSEIIEHYDKKDSFSINMSAIESVAKNLADLCFSIADIREKLKTQAQRNHMRGTFLLISYIIGEYIRKNLHKTYGLTLLSDYKHIDDTTWNVDIIEYADTTEYYNLSTVTTPVALSGNTVNYRFWEADGDDVTGIGLPYEDLDYFYLSTLNIKSVTSSTTNFLNVVFELGADEGYIDRRTGKFVPKIVADDIYDQIEANFEELSAKYYMLSTYQSEIFNTYGGSKLGYDVYYNWKNMAHASYQVHPYLERFVEWGDLQYSIRSAYGGNSNEEVLEALRTEAISTILGEMGETLNIWDRNAIDSTGWKSRYETEKHNVGGRKGESNRLQHYDGVFYPSAVEDYIRLFDGITTESFDLILSGQPISIISSSNEILDTFISTLSRSNSATNSASIEEIQAFRGGITTRAITAEISSVIYGNEKLAYDMRYDVNDKWNLSSDIGKYLQFDWNGAQIVGEYDKILNLDAYDDSKMTPILRSCFNYVKGLHSAESILSNEYAKDSDREEAENLKKDTLAGGFSETFFEKWYGALNLPIEDVQRILAKLIYYHDDIKDLYLNEPSNGFETKYDMFKYGLDKYSNSIIMFKNSEKRIPDYDESRDALGEIWFRFNAHPIGFPLYSANEVLSQIDHEVQGSSKLKDLYEDWMENPTVIPFTHDKKSPRFFFDMDITSDYRFLTLAYNDSEEQVDKYENIRHFLILKTWEDPFKNNDSNQKVISYHWKAPEVNEEDDNYDMEDEGAGWEFQGIFQHNTGMELYLLWAKYDSQGNKFDISRRVIPGSKSEASIYLNSASPTGVILRPGINVSEKNVFRLGYCSGDEGSGCYSLAFLVDFDFVGTNNSSPYQVSREAEIPYTPKTRYAQNYIGRTSKFISEDTNFVTSFSSAYYGVADYYNNPYPIGKNEKRIEYDGVEDDDVNSFDRIKEHVAMISCKNNIFKGGGRSCLQIKYYNLNPDASFIPSYCGLRGFMRIWASKFYNPTNMDGSRKKILYSLELLGYSFNHMKEKFNDFVKQLYDVGDGNYLGTDPAAVLSSGFRVYEQFQGDKNNKPVSNPFYREIYNPVIRFNGHDSATWTIDLGGLDIRNNTLSTFKILVYSVNRGANCPIYACDLSALNNNPPVDHYCRRGTVADDYYLSNRYISAYIVGVVGTPNVLVDDFDPFTATGETNYIMGISSVNSSYDRANGKVKLTFNKQKEVVSDLVNVQEMIIDRNTLVAMVYTDNLWEFNDYHMLYHHHGDWPFLSVFNKHVRPEGKTKDKDYFYADEIKKIELSNYMGRFEGEKYDTDKNGEPTIPLTTHDLEAIQRYPGGPGTDDEKKRLKVITNGTYSFKINEEMESNMKFPPTAWQDTMKDLFNSINRKFDDLSSVIKNGNTYVFELHPPKHIADVIGEVEMEIYADDGEYVRVYENYVSNMYHVSKYEPEFIPFIHMFEGDVSLNVSDNLSDLTSTRGMIYKLEGGKRKEMFDKDGNFLGYETIFDDSDYPNASDDLYDFINNKARDPNKKMWFTLKGNDYFNTDMPVGTIKYEVTEKDIVDSTRLYANYSLSNDINTIYLNFNNFFNSPFQTRDKNGNFVTIYKDNTYLAVDPGEVGDLNVFVQLRYYNYMGKTCGLKDIPILNYTVKNISDDKPKFSIYNTWCTSLWQIAPSKSAATPDDISAWLKVEWNKLGFKEDKPNDPNPLSAYLMEDYTIDSDISAEVSVIVGSPNSQIGSLTCDIVYEFTNPYLEFVPDLCEDAIFDLTKDGIVHVKKVIDYTKKNTNEGEGGGFLTGFTTPRFKLGFRVKKGATIDEETNQIIVPVDAINFEAKDKNNVKYKYTTTEMGGIVLDFRVNGGRKIDRFLKLEDYERGEFPNKEYFNGFELAGDRRLIKIYQNKKYEG